MLWFCILCKQLSCTSMGQCFERIHNPRTSSCQAWKVESRSTRAYFLQPRQLRSRAMQSHYANMWRDASMWLQGGTHLVAARIGQHGELARRE